VKRYLLGRLLSTVPVVFGVITIVFLFLRLVPGDPVEMMLGEDARAADREALRTSLGLDQPLPIQFADYLTGLVQGDLGQSYYFREPVLETLSARYPATLELTLAGLIVGLLVAFPIGILAAVNKDRLLDRASMVLAFVGVAMPTFWLGPLLITYFSIELDWLPVSGREGLDSLILPAVTLGLGLAALSSRMVRATLAENLREDFVRTARAKGVKERLVVGKHALRNALLPVVTIIGLQFGALLSGAVITETIFSWPGVGRLLITAIQTRDYPLVQGGVLLISLTYVFVNLGTDILYALLDPRIRLEQ
jgi:peptide/nickel transport system permease protein